MNKSMTPNEMEMVLSRVREFYDGDENLSDVAKELGSLAATNWRDPEKRSKFANMNSALREIGDLSTDPLTLEQAQDEVNERFMIL